MALAGLVRRPSLGGAAGDREGVGGLTGFVSPRRRQPELLELFEARCLEPLAVLRLRREQHPGVGHQPRHAAPRRQGTHDQDPSAGPHHPVCLGDRASGVGPVLDTAAGDVAVEGVVSEGQRFGVAHELAAVGELRLCVCTAQLVVTLVEHGHGGGVDLLHDSDGGEPGPCAYIERAQTAVAELRESQSCAALLRGPEQRVHPSVVHGETKR